MTVPSSNWHASESLRWPQNVRNLDIKLEVAARVAARVRDGDIVGLGSGSAAYLSLWAIAERVKAEELSIRVVPSSYETEIAATTLNLPLARLGQVTPMWAVDGADEVDPARRVLKGRGGAMFREKLLWTVSPKLFLVIDSSKRVEKLGTGFPLPVEVHPQAVDHVVAFLRGENCTDAYVRTGTGKDGPVITESGFLIVDVHFEEIPVGLHNRLKELPGVLETGLFEDYEFEIVDEQ